MPVHALPVKVKARRIKEGWWILTVGRLTFFGTSLAVVSSRFIDHVRARHPAANS